MGDKLCKGLEAANNVNTGTSIVALLLRREVLSESRMREMSGSFADHERVFL